MVDGKHSETVYAFLSQWTPQIDVVLIVLKTENDLSTDATVNEETRMKQEQLKLQNNLKR